MAPGACLLLPRVNFIARHLAPLHRAFLHRSCLGSSPTLTPSFFCGLQAATAAAAVSSGIYAPPMCLFFVRGCFLASLSLSLSLRVWLIELGKRNIGSGAALESANCSEFRFGLERGTNFVREWRIAVLWVYNAGCGLTKELRFGLCLPCKEEEEGVLHTKLWDWQRFYQVARGSGTLSSLRCPFADSESPERSELCSILPSVSVDISLFLYISCIFRSSCNTSFALNFLCCGCKS